MIWIRHSKCISFLVLFIFIWCWRLSSPSGPMSTTSFLLHCKHFNRKQKELWSLTLGQISFPSVLPSTHGTTDSHLFCTAKKQVRNNSSVFGSASEPRNSPNNRGVLALEATDMEWCLLTRAHTESLRREALFCLLSSVLPRGGHLCLGGQHCPFRLKFASPTVFPVWCSHLPIHYHLNFYVFQGWSTSNILQTNFRIWSPVSWSWHKKKNWQVKERLLGNKLPNE